MLIGILLIIFLIYTFSNLDDSSSKSNSSSYSNNYTKKSNTNTSLSNRSSSSSSYSSKNRSKSSSNYGIKSNAGSTSTSSGYNTRPSSSYTKSSTKKKYNSEKDCGPYKGTDSIYRNNFNKTIEKPKAYFKAANNDKYGYNNKEDKFKDWKKWKATDKKASSSSPIYEKKGGEYYTPNGEKIRNIGAYYNSVKKKKN